jgi:hypothetical protein
MAKATAAAPPKKPTPTAKPAAVLPKKPGSAVARVEPTSTAVGMPAELAQQFLQDSGQGLEKATAQDFALPFIHLLQKGSPQVDPDSEKYVEGAKAGMFINTVTNELYEALTVIPCDFEKVYNEWIPRDAGGGFVAMYRNKNDAEANKREDTQVVDTANHYVLHLNTQEEWQPAILSLTSTKLKASRNWLSKISMVQIAGPGGRKVIAPSFSRVYEIHKEGPVQNEKGTFYIIKVLPVEGEAGWVSDPAVYEQAKAFRTQLQAGVVGADFNRAQGDVEDAVIVDDDGDEKF